MSREYKRDARRLRKRKRRKKEYDRGRHDRRYGRNSRILRKPYSLAQVPGA